MRLDNMILTDFASAVMSPVNSNGEQTTRGTITFVDPDNDKNVEVLIDGTYGGKATAATTMVKCEVDDRVMVLIKNHKATVIGNISSPVLKKVTANDIEAGAVTADTISGTWFYNNEKTSWINLKEGKLNFDNKLIWDGSTLTVNGILTAGAGSMIGPWHIETDRIWYGNKNYGNAAGIYFGTGGISIGSKFKVNAAGNLTVSSDADITGKITASTGKIGPWNIGSNGLYYDSNTYIYPTGIKLASGNQSGTYTFDGIVLASPTASASISAGSITTSYITATSGFVEGNTSLVNKYARLGAANTYTGSQMVNATSGMVGVHYTGKSWLGAVIHAASSGRNGVWSLGYGTPANNSQSGLWLIFRDTDGTVKTRNYVGGESYPVVSTSMDKQIVTTLRTTNATTFAVRGQWGASGTNVEWKNITSSASDPKLKKNIKDTAVNAIDILNKIKLHSFDWKADDVHWDVGFIAPELYDIDKAMAVKPIDDDTAWSVNDFYLLGMSVKAIQELSSKVDYLERRINERSN